MIRHNKYCHKAWSDNVQWYNEIWLSQSVSQLVSDTCTAGTYRDGSVTSCTKCPANSVSEEQGAWTCTPCQLGQISNDEMTECGNYFMATVDFITNPNKYFNDQTQLHLATIFCTVKIVNRISISCVNNISTIYAALNLFYFSALLSRKLQISW